MQSRMGTKWHAHLMPQRTSIFPQARLVVWGEELELELRPELEELLELEKLLGTWTTCALTKVRGLSMWLFFSGASAKAFFIARAQQASAWSTYSCLTCCPPTTVIPADTPNSRNNMKRYGRKVETLCAFMLSWSTFMIAVNFLRSSDSSGSF